MKRRSNIVAVLVIAVLLVSAAALVVKAGPLAQEATDPVATPTPTATAPAVAPVGVTWTASTTGVSGGWLPRSRGEEIDIGGALVQAARVGAWTGSGSTSIELVGLPPDRKFAVGWKHEALSAFAEEIFGYVRSEDGREFELPSLPTRQLFIRPAGVRIEAAAGRQWQVIVYDIGPINW